MKTTTVKLVITTQVSEDDFGNPIEVEQLVDVPGVLVGSPSTDDVVTATQLYGKKVVYVLGIPKGDSHNWTDAVVIIPNPVTGEDEKYRTFGFPITGEPENIPLRWGQNVKVAKYD